MTLLFLPFYGTCGRALLIIWARPQVQGMV
jgi:hypothetical protein